MLFRPRVQRHTHQSHLATKTPHYASPSIPQTTFSPICGVSDTTQCGADTEAWMQRTHPCQYGLVSSIHSSELPYHQSVRASPPSRWAHLAPLHLPYPQPVSGRPVLPPTRSSDHTGILFTVLRMSRDPLHYPQANSEAPRQPSASISAVNTAISDPIQPMTGIHAPLQPHSSFVSSHTDP